MKKTMMVGVLAGMAMVAQADELLIESFDKTGCLVFEELPTATGYRVEWAPTPSGPWTNSWGTLATITASGSGSITCSVPMCYRVVAQLGSTPSTAPTDILLSNSTVAENEEIGRAHV